MNTNIKDIHDLTNGGAVGIISEGFVSLCCWYGFMGYGRDGWWEGVVVWALEVIHES